MTTLIADLLLFLLALPGVLSCGYLLLLTLCSRASPPPPRSSRSLRFQVVVPAHDEAALIARAVRSLKRLNWPRDCLRLLVVADNCHDATAQLARAAGAEVIERQDPERRGKGYALAHAFARVRDRAWADAVIVVDADSEVSTNLVEACAARIEAGAQAVQVHYGILNPQDSWRTRLMTIAIGAFHRVRSRARERLRLSCGIRGNGWCVTRVLLAQMPYGAYSLTEDLEYGITLGLAGVRVHYADEAAVCAAMVSSETLARSQRARWEGGRFQQIRRRSLPLLRAAWQRRSPVCLDLLLDLLVLPLSYVVLYVVLLLILGTVARLMDVALALWLWMAVACALSLAAYVLSGWQLSGTGWRGLVDLARAPFFLAWKLILLLRRPAPEEWVRTGRELR